MLAIIALFGVCSFAQPRQRQASPGAPPRKLDTDLVSLSVVVRDQQGQAITGLKQEDFKVYENGIEQAISSYSAADAPVSWGLVLDRSGLERKIMDEVYHAAFHIIAERAGRDEALLVAFDEQAEMVSDFTSEYGQLLSALRRTRPGQRAALYDAIAFALDHIQQGKNQKKVLLVVTDGGDNGSRITFRRLRERARREAVPIYIVGLTSALSAQPRGRKGEQWQRELRGLAATTGARADFPKDVAQCEAAMKTMVEEVGHRYHIEYRSTAALDGKWRKIRVVAGRGADKNLQVTQSRAGYFASKNR
jgi:Ca-activated chloride channel homolog